MDAELEKGNDVILATHSYGGVPGSNACEGYLKKDRAGKAGILGMIFICSFALPKGVSLWMGLNCQPMPWFIEKVRMRERCILLNLPILTPRSQGDFLEAGTPEDIFYADCSVGEKAQYRASLKPHSYK